jgi:hypothetical protein
MCRVEVRWTEHEASDHAVDLEQRHRGGEWIRGPDEGSATTKIFEWDGERRAGGEIRDRDGGSTRPEPRIPIESRLADGIP